MHTLRHSIKVTILLDFQYSGFEQNCLSEKWISSAASRCLHIGTSESVLLTILGIIIPRSTNHLSVSLSRYLRSSSQLGDLWIQVLLGLKVCIGTMIFQVWLWVWLIGRIKVDFKEVLNEASIKVTCVIISFNFLLLATFKATCNQYEYITFTAVTCCVLQGPCRFQGWVIRPDCTK